MGSHERQVSEPQSWEPIGDTMQATVQARGHGNEA